MRGKDYSRFVELCRNQARPFLDGRGPVFITRAPGRIDVMGGVADYSGSMVLEGAIADAAFIALQHREDDRLRVQTCQGEEEGLEPTVELRLGALRQSGRLRSYPEVRSVLTARPAEAWAAYVLGAYYVLQKERKLPAFRRGANILLHSTVPLGGGVSSSAALEVAGMHAVCAAYDIKLEPLELARLCQIVENRVVGAPCGIMDQVTIALGQQGTLLPIVCRPHEVLDAERLPGGWRVAGINSCVKHSVGGYRYTRARCGAFMGRKIIETHLGGAFVGGHLCNVTPADYRKHCRSLLPLRMTGEKFLARYGDTDDPITSPVPDMVYSVRTCAEHPIYENARVEAFREVMTRAREGDDRAGVRAGRLMYGSHWSYGRIGLGCRECDLLVRLAKQRGPEQGILGAKISGGGSGGTVVYLTTPAGAKLLPQIAREYQEQTGIRPQLIGGSSPGALAWGIERIDL
jgi:galactokinase